MCIFAMYVLPVSAVDGGRKGMSEGQRKQRGEQGVIPSQQRGASRPCGKTRLRESCVIASEKRPGELKREQGPHPKDC